MAFSVEVEHRMAKYEPQDERLQEVLLQELMELPRCIVCRWSCVVSCACRVDGQHVPECYIGLGGRVRMWGKFQRSFWTSSKEDWMYLVHLS